MQQTGFLWEQEGTQELGAHNSRELPKASVGSFLCPTVFEERQGTILVPTELTQELMELQEFWSLLKVPSPCAG